MSQKLDPHRIATETERAGKESALLSAFNDRIKRNLREKISAEIQPMVDAMISEAVNAAVLDLDASIRAMVSVEMNDLVILLKVGEHEQKRANHPYGVNP